MTDNEHQRELSFWGYTVTLRSFLISLVIMMIIVLLSYVLLSVFYHRPMIVLNGIVPATSSSANRN